MAITQTRSKRTATGGRYKSYRKKRIFEMGNSPIKTKVGERQVKERRTVGGNTKKVLLHANEINLVIKGKPIKAKILKEKENTANRNYIRRNILTKGAVVETDKGLAKITNRPGQEPTINGILVE
ncbi:MAG: 30S ribosomal protein S8e [Nanoarchaeota archaeon]|nr:30S ribosomal protein S8e [Nanoarchaeota archaeon]